MKEIVVISGKGGTGKTVLTAALASLADAKIMADCDVDAADLHLLLSPDTKEEGEFRSGITAYVGQKRCISCGKCKEVCRFSAVGDDFTHAPDRFKRTVQGFASNRNFERKETNGEKALSFTINPVSCEGCGFCKFVCPVDAIEMKENLSGRWFVSNTRFGPFVHARLGIAEENSGKLVSLVKEKAKELAEKNKASFIIVDGSPGIGCPVIASLSGADCAIVVTEPTLSGLADAKRVINVAKHFKIPVKLVINKFDLNLEVTKKIENYCKEDKINLLGKLPFDKSVVEALVAQKTLLEAASENIKKIIKDIWVKLNSQL